MTRHHRPRKLLGLAGLVAILIVNHPALADKINLRGGGQVKGKLIPDVAHPGQFLLIGESGKTPMSLKPDQVLQVVTEKGDLDHYVILRENERKTAREEYDLGVWCEEHNFKDLAVVHYEKALKHDSQFDDAHQKLGHVLMRGRWLVGDEVKEAQGFIKYKGRWVTPEEKERKDALLAVAAESNSWNKKIKGLRDAYEAGPLSRSQEAERRLLAINEVIAVGPVLRILGEDPVPAIRAMASRVLGGIPGPEAANGLVGRFLMEGDEAVRQLTMNELAKRDSAEMIPLLARSLRSTHHQVVNRSAWGLGNLNAVAVVPRLIPALITVEQEVIVVDSGSGGNGTSFNGGPSTGGIGNSTRSIPVLTPPVVGQGVVAYGATSVPLGSNFNVASGGSMGPVQKLVPIEYRNEEVHDALVKLTGRDFGYDIAAWKQWLATSFKVEAAPTRRVRDP